MRVECSFLYKKKMEAYSDQAIDASHQFASLGRSQAGNQHIGLQLPGSDRGHMSVTTARIRQRSQECYNYQDQTEVT